LKLHPRRDATRAWLSRPRRADIQRESKKTEKSVKECMKRNDVRSAKVLARELVRTRATVGRMYASKAQMNSVTMHLNENLGALRSSACATANLPSRFPHACAHSQPPPPPQRCTARWATSRRAAS
jgi:hypothetical protein